MCSPIMFLMSDMSYDLKNFCKKEKGNSSLQKKDYCPMFLENREVKELYKDIWKLGYRDLYDILHKGADYKRLIKSCS